MSTASPTRRLVAIIGTATAALSLTSCAVGSIGGSDEGGVTIRLTNFNTEDAVEYSNTLIEGFEAENPGITVELDTIPGGSDGDNLIKTRLSTGDMTEVFAYNSGSLLQAIRPDQYLVPLDGEPWLSHISESFRPAVSTDRGTYGAPSGGSTPGGVIYNKRIYQELGLSVPVTWDEFRANNQKILDSGVAAPVEQTYGDSWTAQPLILADFANIAAAEPDWADRYTANQAGFAQEPALSSWTHLQQIHDDGFLNEDYASALYDEGVRAVATGTAAHYPMLAGVIDAVEQNHPEHLDDIGMFALPAQNAEDTRLTLFMPGGFYIPKTAQGDELDAAKRFVAHTQSEAGCEALIATGSTGPFMNDLCVTPENTPAAIQDVQAYVDAGKAGPALESVSPVKGPNLPQLAVEVGSGIRDGRSGAELYDQDVEKQAQQLGLEGW
jgi:raffinose/stachyose/melibiose transport system substrate-binding protein